MGLLINPKISSLSPSSFSKVKPEFRRAIENLRAPVWRGLDFVLSLTAGWLC
jgi:hypothetical protein